MPYLFTFREILNLAKEFGRSLPRKHLIPRYFNIDRYARQKYGLISMCILSFDTSTIIEVGIVTNIFVQTASVPFAHFNKSKINFMLILNAQVTSVFKTKRASLQYYPNNL